MKLVLVGNRVVSHGGNYICMGGTVVDKYTGNVYQNATIVECTGCPSDIDVVGYEYHAGTFVPCAPFGIEKEKEKSYLMVACKDCGTPKRSDILLSDILGAELTVMAPFGTTITARNGSRVITLEYNDSKDKFIYNLPEYGTWTVNANYKGLTASDTVEVDVLKPYLLELGSAIMVTCPDGVVCTCTKGDITLTEPVENGAAIFAVLGTGTYTLKIQNGDTVSSAELNITEAGYIHFVELDFFTAQIAVTYPVGAVCTCSNGTTTFTAPNTSGSHTFTVSKAGTWTITAVGTYETKSANVNITTDKETQNVTIKFFSATIDVTYPTGATCTCSNGSTTLTAPNTSGSATFIVEKTGTWVVSIAAGTKYAEESVTVSETENARNIVLDFPKSTITVTYPAGAVCTCAKGSTLLGAPDTSGSVVFTVYEAGAWVVTVTDGTNTSTNTINIIALETDNKSISISLAPVVSTSPVAGVTYSSGISGLSWETLSEYAKAIAINGSVTKTTSAVYIDHGTQHNKISVGDKKTVTFSGVSAEVQIIGFNHTNVADSTSYGAAKAGMTFDFVQLSDNQNLKMKHSQSSTGGKTWSASSVRSSLNAKTFNSDLENVIVSASVPCVSSNSGGSLTNITDKIFILSEYEITGKVEKGATAEGSQYAYYAAGNSKKKYSSGTAVIWWTRTPYVNSESSNFYAQITANGTIGGARVDFENWAVPAFCV